MLLLGHDFSLLAAAPNSLADDFVVAVELYREGSVADLEHAQQLLAGRITTELITQSSTVKAIGDELLERLGRLVAAPPYATNRSIGGEQGRGGDAAPTKLVTVVTDLLMAERALRDLKSLYSWLLEEFKHRVERPGSHSDLTNRMRHFMTSDVDILERSY